MKRVIPWLLVVQWAVPLTGCDILREANALSPSMEAELGVSTAASVEDEYGIVTDSPVQSYLDRIGADLVLHSDDPTSGLYRFRMLDTNEVNAFAVPGAWVYVTKGLVAMCVREAELVGVLGHEIAHVTSRHGGKSVTRNVAVLLAAVAARGLDEEPSVVREAGGVAVYLGGTLISMRFSREHETQADTLGVQTAYRAGYDPEGIVWFFERLEQLSPSVGPGWLSSHPKNEDRVLTTLEVIERMRSRHSLVRDSANYRAFRRYVRGR